MAIVGGPDSPDIETDPSTSVGMVRLLITDTDPDNALFTDAAIQKILDSNASSPKRAAAALLSVIAVSETLISKKFSTQDLSVDGPAVAASLLKQADRLRAEADLEDPAGVGVAVAPVWSFPPPDLRFDYPTYF